MRKKTRLCVARPHASRWLLLDPILGPKVFDRPRSLFRRLSTRGYGQGFIVKDTSSSMALYKIKEPRLCQILRKILCPIIRKVTLERTRQLAQGSGLIETHVADVTDDASVEQLFDAVVERSGRLNNAGINVPPVPLDQLSTAELRSIIATNLLGSFLCARCVHAWSPK
jgi:hypothetical protein